MDIFNLTLEELSNFVLLQGEKKFRAEQVYEWLHNHKIISYDSMHNVPKKLKSALEEEYPLDLLEIKDVQVSNDGTEKFLFSCVDDELIESVLIPNDDGRLTACISTQVGCPMKCVFCATGNQGFTRNLSSQEIMFQLNHMSLHNQKRIDNVVVMGQGEPFLNYDNTIRAIKRINHDEAHKIASRKITNSTCGIIQGINRFADEEEQFGLAISLHSAVKKTRDKLLPKMKDVSLCSLSDSLFHYQQKTGRRITFEYMLLEGVNDSFEECEALVQFCEPFVCHVNLLHFNSVECSALKPSSKDKFSFFERQLGANRVACSVRRSKGVDIDGACGQLASKN